MISRPAVPLLAETNSRSCPMRALFILSSCSILFLAIFFASESAAQTTTSGGMIGVVTDQSGAVVAGADVELKDNSKGTRQSTRSDGEGVYRFFFVVPSKYVLTVMHEG